MSLCQDMILDLLRERGPMTYGQIAMELFDGTKTDKNRVFRSCKNLRRYGYIVPAGYTKARTGQTERLWRAAE